MDFRDTTLPPLNRRDESPMAQHGRRFMQRDDRKGNPPPMPDASLVTRLSSLEDENKAILNELENIRQSFRSNQMPERMEWLIRTVQELERRNNNSSMIGSTGTSEVQQLQTAFNQKQLSDKEFQEKEKQKGSILFGEVVRLGKELEKAQGKTEYTMLEIQRRMDTLEATRVHNISKPSTTTTPNTVDQLQLSTLKTMVQQLQDELQAERYERQKLDEQKANDIAQLRGTLSRTDAGIEERINYQFDTLNKKIESARTENARKFQEHHGEVVNTNVQRASDATNEFKKIYEQMNALEGFIASETTKARDAVMDVSKETETRYQALAVELGKEVSSRGNVQQQIEDELRNRFGDLNEATRDVTSDIQTELMNLEEVVRLEIKARIKATEKLKKRVETITDGLTRAIETSRQESRQNYEELQVHLVSSDSMQENMFQTVEKHVKSLILADEQEHRLAMNDLSSRYATLSKALEAEHEARAEMGKEITESLQEQQQHTGTAFESVQQLVLCNHDEIQDALEQHKTASAEELNIVAESVQEMTSLWAKGIRDEFIELQNDTDVAYTALLNRQEHSESRISTNIDKFSIELTEIKEKREIADCVHELTRKVAEIAHQNDHIALVERCDDANLLFERWQRATENQLADLKDDIQTSNSALAESDRKILALREQDNERIDNATTTLADAIVNTDASIESTKALLTTCQTQVDLLIQDTKVLRTDHDGVSSMFNDFTQSSTASIDKNSLSIQTVNSLVESTQKEMETKLQVAQTAQTTDAKLASERLDSLEKNLMETKSEQDRRNTELGTWETSVTEKLEELSTKLRETEEVIGHVAGANDTQRAEDQQKIDKLSTGIETQLSQLSTNVTDLNSKIEQNGESNMSLKSFVDTLSEKMKETGDINTKWREDMRGQVDGLQSELKETADRSNKLQEIITKEWTTVTNGLSEQVTTLNKTTDVLTASAAGSQEIIKETIAKSIESYDTKLDSLSKKNIENIADAVKTSEAKLTKKIEADSEKLTSLSTQMTAQMTQWSEKIVDLKKVVDSSTETTVLLRGRIEKLEKPTETA